MIWATVLAVLFFAASILGRIVNDDAREWLRWITHRLIDKAVSRLPESERERYAEEWRSHLNECPGDLAKVFVAFKFLSAAKSINGIVQFGDNPLPGERSLRAIDVVLSAAMVISVLPLCAFVGLLIKSDSPGPVLFRRTCVGRNGQPFALVKFRTFALIPNEAGGPRVTRVGRVLRLVRLDELPMLLNVLRGDMSFVGPRPSSEGNPKVKPGITGWAQLNDIDVKEPDPKTEEDYYLENRSVRSYLRILVRTVIIFFWRK